MSISNRAELETKVLQFISLKVNRPVEELPLEASFQSLGMESMDVLDLFFALEDEFNLSIEDEDARKLNSLQELIAFLGRELKL
ncbi:MAG: phosphopantetheine-binding protein [Vulcanimicrobiota bacterium]